MAINTTKKKSNAPYDLGSYTSGNFTPNYDYVSGYYKPNAGYENPSRYGYKSSMYNIPTNAGFGIPMKDNDPYWNVGAMLGGLWGANYNKRGAEKATKAAEAELQDAYNKAMGIEQKPMTEGSFGKTAPTEQANPDVAMPKKEDVPADAQNQGVFGKTLSPEQSEQIQLRNDFKKSMYDRYSSGSPNPVGDEKEGSKVGEAVGADISKIDVTKLPQGFNSDLFRANVISKLRSAGRNEWQIAQAMQSIEPQLLGKQREYNDKTFGDLYQQYDALVKAGRIDDAGIVLDRMKQFNPEQAQSLSKQYDRAAKYQDTKNQIEDRLKLMKEYGASDEEIANARKAIALGGINGGRGLLGGSSRGGSRKSSDGSGGDGTGFGYTKNEWNLYTHLDKKENLSEAEKMTLARLKMKIFGPYATPFGNGQQPGGNVPTRGIDYSNLEQVQGVAGSMVSRLGNNFTSNDILRIAQELRAKGTPAANQVAAEYEQRAAQQRAEEEEAESQKGNAVKDFLMKPVDTPRTKSDSWWNSMMDKWDNRNNK